MKNKTKALAISAVVALTAVIGLTASGCRSNENSNSTADQSSSTTNSQSADQNDGKKINPFDGLEVSFGGLAYDGSVYGDITFEANTDGCAAFVKDYVTFNCDTTNAANGSTVMVQAKWDAKDAKDNGITVTAVEQLYTVSLEEIPEDLTEVQRKQLADYVWDAAKKENGGSHPQEGGFHPYKRGQWLVQSMSEPQLITEKYYLCKDDELPNTLYHAVWEMDLTLKCDTVGLGEDAAVGDVIEEKYYIVGVVETFTTKDDAVLFADNSPTSHGNCLEQYHGYLVSANHGTSQYADYYVVDNAKDSDFLFVKSYQ